MLKQLAVISGLICSMSPIADMLQIRSSASTAKRTCVPYATMWLNYALWSMYGLVKGIMIPIGICNIIGFVLACGFCAYFFHFTSSTEGRRVLVTYAMYVLFAAITVVYIKSEIHPQEIMEHRVGIIACLVSVFLSFSPLLGIRSILDSGTHVMSFPLITANFIACLLWLAYGISNNDSFVVMNNFFGALFGLVCLSFYCFLPYKREPVLG